MGSRCWRLLVAWLTHRYRPTPPPPRPRPVVPLSREVVDEDWRRRRGRR